jgi:glycerophosphoryl diester phosphodiesterase
MPERRLLAIAHRAGNHLRLLKRAEEIGADYVEADVRVHRGRLEVRHLKTVRWLPLLYDRWRVGPWRWRIGLSIAPGWTNRLVLSTLLHRLAPQTGLMIDLKGDDETLAPAVLHALHDAGGERPVIVCSQNWRHIDPLLGEPAVTAVHSIGNARQLQALLARKPFETQGISIDSVLLDEEVVRQLHDRAPIVVTWPINRTSLLERVTALGVDGVITDSLSILRRVVEARRPALLP